VSNQPPDLVTYRHIAGVQINYSRPPVAPYGERGEGPRRCQSTAAFKAKLDA